MTIDHRRLYRSRPTSGRGCLKPSELAGTWIGADSSLRCPDETNQPILYRPAPLLRWFLPHDPSPISTAVISAPNMCVSCRKFDGMVDVQSTISRSTQDSARPPRTLHTLDPSTSTPCLRRRIIVHYNNLRRPSTTLPHSQEAPCYLITDQNSVRGPTLNDAAALSPHSNISANGRRFQRYEAAFPRRLERSMLPCTLWQAPSLLLMKYVFKKETQHGSRDDLLEPLLPVSLQPPGFPFWATATFERFTQNVSSRDERSLASHHHKPTEEYPRLRYQWSASQSPIFFHFLRLRKPRPETPIRMESSLHGRPVLLV